jgi:hypothetical protein
MSALKPKKWRLRGIDLEIACVLDTPAGSNRSPFEAAVYRAWVVGHEDLTTGYGETPKAAILEAKVRATGVPTPPETSLEVNEVLQHLAAIEAWIAGQGGFLEDAKAHVSQAIHEIKVWRGLKR